MSTPVLTQTSAERLLTRFLTRENSGTAENYRKQLEDYRAWTKEDTPGEAVYALLKGGFEMAQRSIERYKASVVGRRDAKGKLISGRGLSAAAINLRLTVLRSLVKQAQASGLVTWELHVANVADERVKDVRGPGEEILNAMLRAAKAKPGAEGRRDYAILRLAGELGLRRREIVGLDLQDFDSEACEIRVLGKGRRQKEAIACTPKTIVAIQAWVSARPRPKADSPLFTNLIPGRTARISGPAVYLIISRLGRSALPARSPRRIGPHKIRHTAITSAVRNAVASGLAREDVKKFSRHKDMRMVARYLDEDDDAQRKLAKAVGSRLD